MTQDNRLVRGRLRQSFSALLLMLPWLLGGCAGTPSPNTLTTGPESRPSVSESVHEASTRFNMPVSWINAVMRQESDGHAHALSPKGAMGLMQLMPSTWSYLRAAYKLGADPYDTHDNIIAGTAYLREMYDLYGSPGFLAAYNAGPGRYESCLRRHRALPAETRHYVAVIAPRLAGAAPEGPSPTRPTAVAALPPALIEAAAADAAPEDSSAPHLPPPVPAQRLASATDDGDDDAADAPRPAHPPQAHGRTASHAAAPAAAAPVGIGHLPGHRPALPPGWYVPVAYANR